MEYRDFVKLIDALKQRPKETEWLEFKEKFHSKEEIGERISAISNSACLCNIKPRSATYQHRAFY
jgi:hypothetical protein